MNYENTKNKLRNLWNIRKQNKQRLIEEEQKNSFITNDITDINRPSHIFKHVVVLNSNWEEAIPVYRNIDGEEIFQSRYINSWSFDLGNIPEFFFTGLRLFHLYRYTEGIEFISQTNSAVPLIQDDYTTRTVYQEVLNENGIEILGLKVHTALILDQNIQTEFPSDEQPIYPVEVKLIARLYNPQDHV